MIQKEFLMNKVAMLGSVAVLLGGVMAAGSAFAADVVEDVANEQVIIVAPYITHQTQNELTTGKRGVYDVNSLTKNVSYADLDLSKQSDDDILIQRINDTARSSCAELKHNIPDPPHAPVYSDQDCIQQAVGQATLVADQLFEHARMAMNTPAQPQEQTAEVTQPEPQVEAQATEAPAPAPEPPAPAPKQDRN
jgi:UrcA family protein